MLQDWDAAVKPPLTTCPERYCFHWGAEGDWFNGAESLHCNIQEVMQDLRPVEQNGCLHPFGKCLRSTLDKTDQDRYEPNEPELKKAGLPWFYFITDANQLVEEVRQAYVEQSRALWGEHGGLE